MRFGSIRVERNVGSSISRVTKREVLIADVG